MYCQRLVLGLLLALSPGCQLFGGVHVTEVATASAKPSNVAALIVVTKDGQPVAELRGSSFKLSEDGQPLDNEAVLLRLLEPTSAVAFHTVLLLDVGAGSTEESRRQLGRAATDFVQRLRSYQSVTVLAFDGSPRPKTIGEFAMDASAATVEPLEGRLRVAADTSRNLRGAVVEALGTLAARLARRGKPLGVANLVVFSAGPDLAGRVTATDFEDRLSRSGAHSYFIGLRGMSSDSDAARLARDGGGEAADFSVLPQTFEQVAAMVSAKSRSYYLLSYCTPSRSGERRLRIEVQLVDDALEVETASVETRFDATGFSAGCSAAKAPRFAEAKRGGQE